MVKIAVIGLGHVGAHVAYTFVKDGVCDELVLIDTNESKVKSECQDLIDSAIFLPHRVNVHIGDYPELRDADLIVNATGKIALLIGNKDRVAELKFCVPNVRSYIPKIKASGFHGILINITNPCDIITREFSKGLGLPAGHVFGTGTGLDTARLISSLAAITGVSPKSIVGYMIGEHGNAQITPWSATAIGGVPFAQWSTNTPIDPDEVENKARMGGWVTFNGKNCTEYAIASTAVRDAYAVLHDEDLIVPASVGLNGAYGEEDVFAGVPCVIGAGGVKKIIELNLTAAEKEKFHGCCEAIRKNMRLADSL